MSFDVAARTQRLVRGTLAVETDRGWFHVPFGPVNLTAGVMQAKDYVGKTITSNLFISPVQYVKYGQPVNVKSVFVEIAATDVSDWKGVGLFHCYVELSEPDEWRPIPTEMAPYAHVPPGARVISAVSVAPILPNNCANPFVDAGIAHEAQVEYPFDARMPGGTATIFVTLMPDGRIVDARVFKSSGNPAFDNAARAAALRSTYTGKIVHCTPTIGQYLFKVTFE